MALKTRSETERERLNIGKLSRREGCHPQTIRRRVKAGQMPAPHFIGERAYWWLDEILAWEAAQMARPPEARRGAKNLAGAEERS
jgi:hypothetical protein